MQPRYEEIVAVEGERQAWDTLDEGGWDWVGVDDAGWFLLGRPPIPHGGFGRLSTVQAGATPGEHGVHTDQPDQHVRSFLLPDGRPKEPAGAWVKTEEEAKVRYGEEIERIRKIAKEAPTARMWRVWRSRHGVMVESEIIVSIDEGQRKFRRLAVEREDRGRGGR